MIGSVAICVLLLGVAIQAQAPQGPPKPGPEVQKLAYFVGNWKEEGKSTAHGMAGPVSSTQKWEWVSGGFFIVGHSDNKSPVGDFKIMAVLGYDPETKMYTYNAFDSWGELITAKGNVSGDVAADSSGDGLAANQWTRALPSLIIESISVSRIPRDSIVPFLRKSKPSLRFVSIPFRQLIV
jgi:hypothetical protein